jgi:hypothetical protein
LVKVQMMSDSKLEIEPDSLPEQIDPDIPKIQPPDSIELGLRFLVGLLSIGTQEAARRLSEMQRKMDENPSLWQIEQPLEEKTLRRQVWYLGVGLIQRSQKKLQRDLRRGFKRFMGAADQASQESARLVGGRLPGPVRNAFEDRLVQWRIKANQLIEEGELETQKGRVLATGAITELIAEIMDELAENPDLQEFVQDLVGQQGVGMATSAVDNVRSVALTADDAAEGLVRWLFRRTPRRELPPSPVVGKSQTMYAPKVKIEGEKLDDKSE